MNTFESNTNLNDPKTTKEKNVMSEQPGSAAQPAASWRLTLGVIIFLISIILLSAGIPVVTALDISTTMKSSVIGGLLVSAEVLGIIAIAVMGKPGYLYIKSLAFGFLKRFGPSDEVSRIRYKIGLVMFCIPLLFGWVSIYAANYIPGFSQR